MTEVLLVPRDPERTRLGLLQLARVNTQHVTPRSIRGLLADGAISQAQADFLTNHLNEGA